METATYTVLQDYKTDRLNGGGPVVWVEGDTVDLGEDDASWVNRDRPGTLAGGDELEAADQAGPDADQAAPDPDQAQAETAATTPAAEQAGGKPPRGSGRRKDSVG